MISLSRLKQLPLIPYAKYAWTELGVGHFGGLFHGTPDKIAPIMGAFFRQGIKKRDYDTGPGFFIVSRIGEECEIRLARTKNNVTRIEIIPDPNGLKSWKFAIAVCKKLMLGKPRILEPFKHITTVGFTNRISQSSWNKHMKLLPPSWKPVYVKMVGRQIMRNGGVDMQYDEGTRHVTIIWIHAHFEELP